METGLFGSDDSISDYMPGKTEWHGTFMVSGSSPSVAEDRRRRVIDRIMDDCKATSFVDGSPKEV